MIIWRAPKLLLVVTTAFAVAYGCFGITRPAQADPHAMFYTAIGQRQLFFNVLAALDQADFVEPVDGKHSRQELLDRRTTAKFGEEKDPALVATETELSSVLTRAITLEGQDLWTAYLKHQLALEVRSRVEVDELLRKYCERGLGLAGCERGGEEGGGARPGKEEDDKKQAYIVDPLERASEAYRLGVQGALGSDTRSGSYDQQRREQIEEDQSEGKLVRPLPFDGGIAAIKEKSSGSIQEEQAINRLIAATENTYYGSTVNARVFDNLEINDETGEVKIKNEEDAEKNPQQYILQYTSALADLVSLPSAFFSSADRGARKIAAFQGTEETAGAIADSEIQPLSAGNVGEPKTEFAGRIVVPAHAKVAAVQSALDTLGDAEQNRKFADPEQIKRAGRIQAVERNGNPAAAQPPGAPPGQPVPPGGPINVPAPGQLVNPQVRGTVDVPHDDGSFYHEDLQDLDAGSQNDLVAVHHEYGAAHLLIAVSPEDSGGCQCSAAGALNDHGGAIMARINRK
jgi:hypothetical protein